MTTLRPPGLWRRIMLCPRPGVMTAGLEDDVHRFHVRLHHAAGLITGVEAEAVRFPWTGCSGAPGHLGSDLAGRTLAEVAATAPLEHCTHLRDLAALAAAHAGDAQDTRLDMHVADRDPAGRTIATLAENDAPVLEWHLTGSVLTPPSALAGRDLRQLSRWQSELTPHLATLSHALRRAVFVSGARAFDPPPGQSATQISDGRIGACFNFRAPQLATTARRDNWRGDFAANGGTPLTGFAADIAISPA